MLKQVYGDVEAAIEYLLAESGFEDAFSKESPANCQADTHGNGWSWKVNEFQVNRADCMENKIKCFYPISMWIKLDFLVLCGIRVAGIDL